MGAVGVFPPAKILQRVQCTRPDMAERPLVMLIGPLIFEYVTICNK